ncbi:flagellar protein flag protein [hydrocarbon metagenome]|uniref:Flagellar protein flag protein n=1 Tax=hydrocarbon metagenome TaxID=938273 RepID=A0A0W8E125_9ZZZZ
MRIEGQGAVESFYNNSQMPSAGKTVNTPAENREVDSTPVIENGDAGIKDKLDKVVKLLNQTINASNNHHLEFQMHEASGRYQVKVINSETSEVIREIPQDFMLELSARIKGVLNEALGLIFDEKR